MNGKTVPMRKCIGCGEMKPKSELLRVVKTADGVTVDPTSKMNGRGAYICKNADCFSSAAKGRRLERAFSMKIPDETYHALEEVIRKNE